MVRRILAGLLSASLVALNPGWASAAPVIKAKLGLVPQTGPTAKLGMGVGLPKLTINPGLNPALKLGTGPTAQKLSINGLSEQIAPQLQLVNEASTGVEGAAGAGSNIQALLEGRKSAPTASFSDPVDGSNSGSSKNASLGKSTQESLPSVEDDYGNYNRRRWALQSIAKHGIVASLPKAGSLLTRKIINQAARRKYLFTDFDDTIGAFNSQLTPELVAGFAAANKAGKTIIVVTDRTDEKRPNSKMLTVFESLETIPAADRAGMIVAANGGGRVYRYNALGEPERIYEQPAMDEAKKAVIAEAAAEAKSKLSTINATQHPGDAVSPSESFNPYGYALMLSVGTEEATVKQAAKLLQSELALKGIEVEVIPRMAKNPANPPYITFSAVNKSMPTAWIAQHLGIKPHEAVSIGDSMYMPRLPETLTDSQQELKALAENNSGAPMPLTGNETDRNMEKGLPDMMALSVGGTADPRMENGWVLEGHGPAQTLKLLEAMAASPTVEEKPMTKAERIGGIALLIAAVGASLGAYYVIFKTFADIATGNYSTPVNPDEVPPYYGPIPTIDDIFMGMGGTLGLVAAKDGQLARFGRTIRKFVSSPVGLTVLVALAAAAAAALFVPGGLAAVVPAILSYKLPAAVGALAMGGMMMQPNLMPNPSRDFALALKQAVAVAKKNGYTDDQVYFGGAAASLPRRDGREWGYTFYLSRDLSKGNVGMVYVDILTGWTSTPDFRVAYYPSVESPSKASAIHELSLAVGPEQALDAVREAQPLFGNRVSMELSPLGSYTIYDERGGKAVVDASNKEVGILLNPAAPTESSLPWNRSKSVTLGLTALLALLYIWPKGLIIAGIIGAAYLLYKIGWTRNSITGDKDEAPGVTDGDIESAAQSVISYKGRPWSQTEYNMGYYNTLENLEKRGATKAQLERFKKLCDEAPVKGGGFNPWSGD